jgi:hypothetical protein
MTYKLDENAPAFSYTKEELFDCITRIVAHPHTTYNHEKTRAMAIFLTFADYLGNYTESDNNHGHVIYESDSTDFEGLDACIQWDEYPGTEIFPLLLISFGSRSLTGFTFRWKWFQIRCDFLITAPSNLECYRRGNYESID